MRTSPCARAAVISLVALLLAACGGGAGRPTFEGVTGGSPNDRSIPLPDDGPGTTGGNGGGGSLQGGVLATFVVQGERFRAWVTNSQVAQQLVDVRDGRLQLTSFGAAIQHGAGAAQHNAPWSWHVNPQLCWVNQPSFGGYNLPSQAENGMNQLRAIAPPNPDPRPAGPQIQMANLVLTGLQDNR